MSRLLFAAARGARVQYGDDETWINPDHVRLNEAEGKWYYRIHPDDAHLEYGPISTALRGAAADDYAVCTNDWLCDVGLKWAIGFSEGPADTYLHRSLLLLILAEALADEGL